MYPEQEFLGSNCIEDVRWLCSLSESELDMLISLKELVQRRAKVIGHQKLAEKFSLKILRALALVLMENVKEKMKNSSHIPDLAKSVSFMNECGLLQSKLGGDLSIEELQSCIGIDRKKRSKRPRDEVAASQKD